MSTRKDFGSLAIIDDDELSNNNNSTSGGAGTSADFSFNRPDSADNHTVEEFVESIGYGWFTLKVALICGLFSATDALEMLLLSVLSPELACEWKLSETQVALITTVVFIGMFSGSAIWGSWSDKYGRWPIMTIGAAWITYFGLLAAASPNYYWILILRGLVGLGFGAAVQSFTCMSEYLPSKHRAKILILYNVTWAAGSCFEILLAYLILPTLGWRYLVGISALPMFITLFAIWFMPESARFLLAAGKPKQAHKVLEQAAKLNGIKMPPGTLLQEDKVKRGQFMDLFSGGYWKTTLLLWLLWFGCAFSYYGIVLLNSEIFEKGAFCVPREVEESCHCHLLTGDDYKSMIVSTFGEFFAIPFNLLTIDWLGRKWTIAINYFAAAVCFVLVQLCSSRITFTIYTFGVRAFTSGIFNIVYIYTIEVYPTTIRSLGLGSGSSMARIGAMITPFIAQVLLEQSPEAALWVYGVICLLCGIASILLPIETRGREMKQTTR